MKKLKTKILGIQWDTASDKLTFDFIDKLEESDEELEESENSSLDSRKKSAKLKRLPKGNFFSNLLRFLILWVLFPPHNQCESFVSTTLVAKFGVG
jgi:hypothetical protein